MNKRTNTKKQANTITIGLQCLARSAVYSMGSFIITKQNQYKQQKITNTKKTDKQIQKAKNQMPKNENKEIQSQQTYNAWQGVWLAGWRAL